MTLLARLLPLVTVAAWILTLFVPVLDSGGGTGPRITLNSLGTGPAFLEDPWPDFVLTWLGVLLCAGSVWFLRRLRVWSVLTMLVAVALALFFTELLLEPPALLWDGVDAQGRPIGGYEEAGPAMGAIAWGIGIAALFAAGVCGLLGSRRRLQIDAH